MVLKDSSHAMKGVDISKGPSERELPDFDLIQEIIIEDSDWPLPRPPPPPVDLLRQDHEMLTQSSSPSSQPVLVARGTACQPTCTFPQLPQQT